eukprot:11625-Heterococcus_DN1.PRE.2
MTCAVAEAAECIEREWHLLFRGHTVPTRLQTRECKKYQLYDLLHATSGFALFTWHVPQLVPQTAAAASTATATAAAVAAITATAATAQVCAIR